MATSTYDLIVKVQDQSSGPLGKITGKLGGAKVAFAAVAAAVGATSAAMINASKQMETITNQLRLVTKNSDDLARTQSRLTELARANRSTLGPTVELYTKLKVATAELGFSNERVEGLVSKLSQALAVAGADAGTTAGVIRQFGQAMASGTVRGDEFNSIVEGMGPALAIMAQESGITVGQLREMSQAGELTAETFAGLLEGSESLTEAFNKMQTPLDTLESQLSEAFTTYLANLSEASGLTSAYRSILEGMIGIFDDQNQAFLEAQSPIGALNIKLEQSKEALALLKAEAMGMNRTAIDTRDAFGLWQEGTDDLKNKIVELTPPVDVLTKAIQDEEENVRNLGYEIAELTRFMELNAAAEKAAAERKAEAVRLAKEAEAAAKAEREEIERRNKALKARGDATNRILQSIQSEQQALKDLQAGLANSAELARLYGVEEAELRKRLQERINAMLGVKQATEEATPAIKTYQSYVQDLLESTRDSLQEDEFKQRALRELFIAYDNGRISIEEFMRAQKLLGVESKKTREELEKTSNSMITYQQFLKQTTDNATKAVTMDQYRAQALRDLFRAYDNGRISLEEFQKAQDALGVRKPTREGAKPKDKPELTALQQLEQQLAKNKAAYDSLDLTQEEIRESAARAGVTYEVFKRQLESTREGMNIFKTDAQLMQEELEKSIESVSASISQQLANAIVEGRSMSEVFQNIFKQMLANILQQIIQSQIQSALGSLLGVGMGGGGGGGFLGMLFGGFRAEGGAVNNSRAYVVGEKGPELFMPGTSGRVVPNDEMAMGGGAPTVNFNIQAIDTQTGTEFILKNKKQIEGVIQGAYERRGKRGIA